MVKVNIFWFRRDLRLDDNKGLSHATKSKYPVLPIFIFDSDITDTLPVNDKRINFIYDQLQMINDQLISKFNSSLLVFKGKPIEVFKKLNSEFNINSVYCNHDYEPYSIVRDKSVESYLDSKDSKLLSFKDQVIFEKSDVVKNDGNPYVVYTPYKNKWKIKLKEDITILDEKIIDNNFFFYKNYSLKKIDFYGFEIMIKLRSLNLIVK